jgi:hypothetical protein
MVTAAYFLDSHVETLGMGERNPWILIFLLLVSRIRLWHLLLTLMMPQLQTPSQVQDVNTQSPLLHHCPT